MNQKKSGWKPGGKGIHRNVFKRSNNTGTTDNKISEKRGGRDARKNSEKYQPYLYVPINKYSKEKV